MNQLIKDALDQKLKISFSEGDFIGDIPFSSLAQASIMPILQKVGSNVRPLGTAFCISGAGLMLTARHVIEHVFNENKERDDTNEVTVDQSECGLYMLYLSCTKNQDGTNLGGLLPITRIVFSDVSDIALLSISLPSIDGELIPLFQHTLSPGLPSIGQKTMALGYSKMKVDFALDKMTFHNGLSASQGIVEEIHEYRRDSAMINFPSFRTNARYDHGMSGAPIFGEKGGVIGIVSSSITNEDGEGPYTSYGVLLPPLFVLKALCVIDPNIGEQEISLYDLASKGLLNVDDSFSRISLHSENGKSTLNYF